MQVVEAQQTIWSVGRKCVISGHECHLKIDNQTGLMVPLHSDDKDLRVPETQQTTLSEKSYLLIACKVAYRVRNLKCVHPCRDHGEDQALSSLCKRGESQLKDTIQSGRMNHIGLAVILVDV